MVIEYLLFFLGLFLLIKGATYLIDGSESIAKRVGISTFIVGLTIVAFGTSLPELIVTVVAALKGESNIILGNVIGSNMSNLLLVLGVVAIIKSFKVKNSTIWKEIPFSILGVVILLIFVRGLFFGAEQVKLGRFEGFILILFFLVFIYYVGSLMRAQKKSSFEKVKHVELQAWKTSSMVIGGVAALYFGGIWTVEGAVYISRQLGLSEFFISASIIALGTSLPELVTSLVALKKKSTDLAVGNIIGSNIFNVFWVLGFALMINTITVSKFIVTDLLFLLFSSFLLLLFVFVDRKHKIEKIEGIVFVALYVAYIGFLLFRG
tara:strand:+ start:2352 stop:3314 length:963 start_codon:yes stop_codon:yes gene_type:complete